MALFVYENDSKKIFRKERKKKKESKKERIDEWMKNDCKGEDKKMTQLWKKKKKKTRKKKKWF